MSRTSCRVALMIFTGFLGATPVTDAQSPGQANPTANTKNVDLYGDLLPSGAFARLGTVRFRTTGGFWVHSALSADGKLLAVPGERLVRLLDPVTGAELRRLTPPGPAAGHASFSSNGQFLAVAGDNRIQVYDLVKNEWLRTLTYDGYLNRRPVVSAHGDTVLIMVRPSDDTERVIFQAWDFATGNKLKSFSVDSVCCDTALSPDGQTIATCVRGSSGPVGEHAAAASIQLMRSRTGKEICRIVWEDPVNALGFTPDGTAVVAYSSSANVIDFYDAASGKKLRRLEAGETAGPFYSPVEMTFSADGENLAIADFDGNVLAFDLAKKRCAGLFATTRREINHKADASFDSLAFSGNRFIGSRMRGVRAEVWDITSREKLMADSGHCYPPSLMWFSRDGCTITSFPGDDSVLYAWDTATQRRRTSDSLSTAEQILRVHRDSSAYDMLADGCYRFRGAVVGKYMALAADAEAKIGLFNHASGKCVVRNIGQADIFSTGIALSPDAKRVTAANWSPDPGGKKGLVCRISVWEAPERKIVGSIRLPMSENSAVSPAFLGDGSRLAIPMDDGTVGVWSIATARRERSFAAHHDCDALRIAVSPDERMIALGLRQRDTKANEIRVWEVASGLLLRDFSGFDATVTYLCFSPDGRTLASGHSDSTILLWDVSGQRGHPASNAPLSSADIFSLWKDLDSLVPERVWRASGRLTSNPKEAIALFTREIGPVQETRRDYTQISRLIHDLDARRSSVRDAAFRELREIGEAAAPSLRQALERNGSAEAREAIGRLLGEMEGTGPPRNLIRPVRALAILEAIGTTEAKALIRRIASGRPAALLTTEVEYSLRRLARREAQEP